MTPDRRCFTREERETLAILAGGSCTECGDELTSENMEADHFIPFSAGGMTTLENGAALCRTCNREKGASIPQDDEVGETGIEEGKPLQLPVFQSTSGFNDRRSQKGFMSAFVASWIGLGKANFLAEMGTGSGKTACGVSAAHHLFECHAAERTAGAPLRQRRGVRLAIILTPTTGIREEWRREFARFAQMGGPEITVRQPMGAAWAGISGNLDFPKDGEVILASPQSLATKSVRDALRMMIHKVRGEVAVIVDEVHHCAEGNTWGSCIAAVAGDARVVVGLSGTPYRHDDGRILGVEMDADGEIVPDYLYSKAESLAHGVVAPLHFRTVEGVIRETDGRSDKVIREGKLSECRDQMADDFLKHALKPGAETLDLCLEEGIRALTSVRATDQGPLEPAGAIQCATISQLRYVKAFLEQRGFHVMATFQGDGMKPQHVINRFRAGEGDWILGLRRLTEGVNIERLRVGVGVNYMCTTRQNFEQFSARPERLIKGIPADDQVGYIIIPKHHRFEQYALDYEKERKEAEVIRKMATCDCPACGASIASLAATCPFCETITKSERGAAPWTVGESNLVPNKVTQTAYLANFIHRSRSLTVEEAAELAAAYDLRCRRSGMSGAQGLGVEIRAFRELRLRMKEAAAA